MNELSSLRAVLALIPFALFACACSEEATDKPGKDVSAAQRTAKWLKIKADVRARFPEVSHWTTEDVEAALERDDVVLVDVRRAAEWDVSRIPGAIHVPATLSDIDLFDSVPRDKTIVVYCSAGMRSAAVARRLANVDRNVHNYIGSIFEWANRGLPLEADSGPVKLVHGFSQSWSELVRPEYRSL